MRFARREPGPFFFLKNPTPRKPVLGDGTWAAATSALALGAQSTDPRHPHARIGNYSGATWSWDRGPGGIEAEGALPGGQG